MNIITRWITIFGILLVAGAPIPAQQKERFHPEWLAMDIANTAYLAKVPQLDLPQLDALERALGPGHYEADRGFGLRTVVFFHEQRGGYAHIGVSAFIYRDQIIRYRVEISGREDSWWMLRADLIAGWKRNTTLEYHEFERGLFYEREYPAVLDAYKRSVSDELGPMQTVTVPAELKNAYDLLTSPYESSVVGFGGCGYAGVLPRGKEAIDALVSAKRIDLIENVLSGYNSGGRVYAALALLKLERTGVDLSNTTKAIVKKVIELEIDIESCGGCIYSFLSAKQVLERFWKFEEALHSYREQLRTQ